MPKEKTPLRPVLIDYLYDECGDGHMRPEGYALLSSPPQYPHKCDKCGHEQTFKVSYPTTDFETINE